MGNPHRNSQLHVAMFPWFAYGHFIPFLHLSNKLAERGHRVSFLLPPSAQQRLSQENKYPDLLSFLPVILPHVDGLPPGVETNSDIPFSLLSHLHEAFDKTKPQVKSYLSDLKPDFVVFDSACWIPALSRDSWSEGGGFKTVRYSVVSPNVEAFYLTPGRKMHKETTTVDDLMLPPPGCPFPSVQIARHEAQSASFYLTDLGGITFHERLTTGFREADVIATRTYRQVEGRFVDYVAEQYAKPALYTGPLMPKASDTQLDEKWATWLNKFDAGSVVYCAIGSQTKLEKNQFQELVLGFELTGLPFLVALSPPQGCASVEEALPEGFEERVQGRGLVYGGWVPQRMILEHPSTGCFVSHFGYGSMWEALLSDCQIVTVPLFLDQVFSARLMVNEFKVALEIERDENEWISKESLSQTICLAMDKENALAADVKRNLDELRRMVTDPRLEEETFDDFIRGLQVLLETKKEA